MADGLLPGALRDPDGNQEEREGTVSLFDGPAPTVQILNDVEAEIAAVATFLGEAAANPLNYVNPAGLARPAGELAGAAAEAAPQVKF